MLCCYQGFGLLIQWLKNESVDMFTETQTDVFVYIIETQHEL